MRVNMDSSIASDPRFKLVAAALDVKLTEVIGSCFQLWLACYERRSERLRKVEADVAAGLSGFADALAAEDLAEDLGDGTVIVHGVATRIRFLERQAERGSKGGKSKKKPNGKADAKQVLEQTPSTDSQTAQANTLTLTPALSPDLTPTQAPAGVPRKRAQVLPSDWQPDESHQKIATELGLNLNSEADKFRDYYAANGRTMKDWTASFRNWLRKSAEWGGKKSTATAQKGGGLSAAEIWQMAESMGDDE